MGNSLEERALSHLLRSKELYQKLDGLRNSTKVAEAFQVAEHSFIAILLSFNIRIGNDHKLHERARENKQALSTIWQKLEPILEDYKWLYQNRNINRYNHIDTPQESNFEVDKKDVERALQTGLKLINIAKKLLSTGNKN